MKSFGMNLLLHAIYNILLGSLEFSALCESNFIRIPVTCCNCRG